MANSALDNMSEREQLRCVHDAVSDPRMRKKVTAKSRRLFMRGLRQRKVA